MAIRFSCASCRQPIEVDDEWGGQAVACPYCRRVVNAPRQSDWPPGNVPVASPARGAFSAPPPPAGRPASADAFGGESSASASTRIGGPSTASWALLLALAAAVLCVVGLTIWSVPPYERAMREAGEGASPEQVQRAFQQIIVKGEAPASPAAVTTLLVGVICGIAALALALKSLATRENHSVKAVAACLIAALFVVCQGIFMLAIFHQGGA